VAQPRESLRRSVVPGAKPSWAKTGCDRELTPP